MRQDKIITISEGDVHSVKLYKYVNYLKEILNCIDDELKESAEIEFDHYENNGSSMVKQIITYVRPETDEEMSERESKEKLVKERRRDMEIKRAKETLAKYNVEL